MARTINFVQERQRSLSKQEQRDHKILRQAMLALFVTGGLLVVVVGTRLGMVQWHQSIKDQQQAAISQIQEREDIERSYTVFVSKLNVVTELFGKRKEKQDALEYFSSLFDPDIIISQLQYEAENDVLTFTIQAPSIFRMEQVFGIMQSEDVNARYPDLQRDTLRRSGDGSYGMQVTLMFGDAQSSLTRLEGEGAVDENGEPIEVEAGEEGFEETAEEF
ncbi:MAG: hypothetical protein WDZ94_05690 [Patescibacteria group bacterium]